VKVHHQIAPPTGNGWNHLPAEAKGFQSVIGTIEKEILFVYIA